MTTYESAYTSLNAKQKEAVDAIYGPVLVIAGPGSGKTQLLSVRIANILQATDYQPYNILCLTFTESAATNMRERLASMIGDAAYRIPIHTFHSFGNEIINRFRYMFREYTDAKPIDKMMASKILDDILTDLSYDDPYKPGYKASDTIKEILDTIKNLKEGGISPVAFSQIVEKNIEILGTLDPILSAYFAQIGALGMKKEEKEQKRHIFATCVENISKKYNNSGNIAGYSDIGTIIVQKLQFALAADTLDGKIKYISDFSETYMSKSPDGTKHLKDISKIKKQQSLAKIYTTYQQHLLENGYIDFSDMILRAIEIVETNADVRATLAETYQCIMIDEFQDTNAAQMRLVHAIASVAGESPNVFAVGDDAQGIYKFQGANTENIRKFHDTYADTRLILLDTNYRSKIEIIDVSCTIVEPQLNNISHIFPGETKKFISHRGEGADISYKKYATETEEYTDIVNDIKKKIQTGTRPQDIAIIVKKNVTICYISALLRSQNIPVYASTKESLFDMDIIRLISKILRYVHSLRGGYVTEERETLVDILAHPCFHIHRLTLWQISRDTYSARNIDNKSWIENLRTHADSDIRDIAYFFIDLSYRAHTERLEDILDIITGACTIQLADEYDEDETKVHIPQIDILGGGQKSYISPIYTYFFDIHTADICTNIDSNDDNISNIKPQLLYTEKIQNLANLAKYTETVRSFKQGKTFLQVEDATEMHKIIDIYAIHIDVPHTYGDEQTCVQCISVHKAKGLEWKHVYVPATTSKQYANGKNGGSPLPKNLPLEPEKDDEGDIERLVYTACTRAEDSLYLSYSEKTLTGAANSILPCIARIVDRYLHVDVPATDIIHTLSSQGMEYSMSYISREHISLASHPYRDTEKGFLSHILKNFSMSVTALQNFLNITSGGPDGFVANSLLRFPSAKNASASYGSAIHAALEKFFQNYMTNQVFDKDILHSTFHEYIHREGFSPIHTRDMLEKGHANIEALYVELISQNYGKLYLEHDFRSAQLHIGDVHITGKIDYIEQTADDTLVIIDYKTGTGFDTLDTSGADHIQIKKWKYRLQLTFYALLFELSPRFRLFPQRTYQLFFVEKDQKTGTFHRVTEYIQQGEIERLRKLITAVMARIRTLDFPDTSHYSQDIHGIRQFEEDILAGNI